MAKKTYTATFRGTQIETLAALQPVMNEYAHYLARNLDITNPHQNPTDPMVSKTDIYIRFWSWPTTTTAKRIAAPTHIYDIPLDEGQKDDWHIPAGGTQIKDPTNKYTVATIVDSTVYIPFDLPHSNNGETTAAIMRNIMAEVVKKFRTQAQIAKQMSSYIADNSVKTENAPQMYAKICNERLFLALETKKNNLARAVTQNVNLKRQYMESIRQVGLLEQEVSTFKVVEASEAKFIKEFDMIQKLPKVKSVKILGRKIIVSTEHLNSQRCHDGTIRSLGAFNIEISVDEGNIRFFNLTRQVERTQHPHVDMTGHPCLGNIQHSLIDLIARYEFAPVTDIALKFLQSCNERGGYWENLVRWPILEEAKKEEVKKVATA